MLDNKPKSKVILDELRSELNEDNEVPIPETTVNQPQVVRTQETRVPRHSGRVVTQPEHTMEGFEVHRRRSSTSSSTRSLFFQQRSFLSDLKEN